VVKLGPDDRVHPGRVDTLVSSGGEAMVAEAEPEQKAGEGVERDEIALVVVAVLEHVVVERFRDDRGDVVPRDVGDEGSCIGAGVRVCRAEVGRIGVAEGVAGHAVLKLVQPVCVEEARPRALNAPPAACGTSLRGRLPGGRAD
jgi:hypothetical protein